MNAYDQITKDLDAVMDIALMAQEDVTTDLTHTSIEMRNFAFGAYRTICNAMLDLTIMRERVEDSRQNA